MQWCEEDPAELNSILDAVLDRMEIGIWLWYVGEDRTVVDEHWARIVGREGTGLSEFTRKEWESLAHPDDVGNLRRSMEDFLSGMTDRYELVYRLWHAKGRYIWVRARGVVVERDAAGRPSLIAGAHQDISEQVQNEERLLELSIRDPLTGLFNRRRVFERMSELIAKCVRGGEPISVVLFDIDRFKSINDGYGHQTGDQALRDFAAILREGIREYDVVGRYGGEEFLAILDGSDAATAAAIVERILAVVRSRETVHETAVVRFTASAGIACSAEFETSFLSEATLLSLADARLYCAKEAGRDQVIWRSPKGGGCELE